MGHGGQEAPHSLQCTPTGESVSELMQFPVRQLPSEIVAQLNPFESYLQPCGPRVAASRKLGRLVARFGGRHIAAETIRVPHMKRHVEG